MSRSFRDLLKLSAPVLLSAALLSGCGSGSSGSADLDSGGGPPVTQPPPPVASTTTFNFSSVVDWFVVGTPPTHVKFSGGTATSAGGGNWIIPEGQTGIIEFGTPADAVRFSTEDDFSATASSGSGAQKTGAITGRRAVDAPFNRPMYVRGTMNDWADPPPASALLKEVADNVLAVTLPLTAQEYKFKVSDAGWTAGTDCGKKGASAEVIVGTPYELDCGGGFNDMTLNIPADGPYKFTLDVTGAPKVTVALDTGDGGNGGGEEPEDSTVIRIHSVTVVASGTAPAGQESVEEIKGLGTLSVDVSRRGGEPRVHRIEIENLGTNGDIGVAEFAWTADARFALKPVTVDIFYTLPTGSAAGTKIVVGGRTYDCVAPPPNTTFSCVARNVEATPFANANMTVRNADGSTRETIIFNGGSGADDVYAYSGSPYATTGTPAEPPAVLNAAAHWVKADTLLWNPPGAPTKVELLFSPNSSIVLGPSGFTGTFQTITLSAGTNPKPEFNKQLWDHAAWSLGAAAANAREIARGQLVAVARNSVGEILGSTYVQTAGALDDLYASAAYGAKLGVSYASGVPSLAVWAPTALKTPGLSVNVYEANGALIETRPMVLDEASGIWRVTGAASWDRKFYTISLRVYSYAANAVVNNEVTDPYSVSLAMDSVRSQFVNLDDVDLKPPGWDSLQQPALQAPEDIVVYELHVRDFSIADGSVPDAHRGKFTAFDLAGTAGRMHLQKLQQAGLTHVHLLPAFDIATVKENPADRVDLDDPVERLCQKNTAAANLCVTDAGKTIRRAMEDAVASGWLDRPQQIVNWMRQLDGFNWGYDPFHFGVPEGSYSTNPNGETRIFEFRRMVKGINDLNLRTVMDVVYNHTNASGQNPKSVLDKVVPGYYHRRDNTTGNVLMDGCCDNTAAEFRMMEKLMIDTGVSWVRDYKVSGFRFDLMNLHPLDSMERFQDAVKAVDPSVYIYGEGWNFGANENDKRFKAARQLNLKGTGIGSFSDRIRDPLKGGGCCDGGDSLVKNQGFVNGWFYDPNEMNTGSTTDRRNLIAATDNIRVWLAGGLADFQLQSSTGEVKTGAQIEYSGSPPSGYTADPEEAINYVEKHDNQTLWDLGAYRHPLGTSLADRVRSHNVGLAVILLGQGIPFIHAGSDILRSKSGDRDSYDSGDWFNEIDWTMSGTKWAQGLPIADKNEPVWPLLEPRYRDVPRPDSAAQQRAFDHVQDMLKIRKSSRLFRLGDADEIQLRVKFHNTGPSQIPGLVAMGIDGCANPGQPAPDRGAVMAIFNASNQPQTVNLFGGESWTLHPVLANSTDPVVKTAKHDANGFFVPARTTAVFERAEQKSCAPFAVEMYVRGIGTDWSASPQNRFNFLGGTAYEVVKPLALGADPDGFKIADANWTGGTDCGAMSPVVFGEPLTLACQGPGNGNIGMTVSSAGDYVFRLDAASTANPILTVTKKAAYSVPVFVRGVGTDWSDSPGNKLQQAADSSVHRVIINVLAAGPDPDGFKIADSTWGVVDCGSNTGLTIGQPLTLVCNGPGNGNIGVTWPATGTYLFSLDATNPMAPKLTVEKTPFNADLFVRGVGTDWSDSAGNKMTYLGGGQYRLRRAATAGADPDGFKIADSTWGVVDCGSNTGLTIGQPLALVCNGPGNGNIGVTWPATGTYTFSLDATNSGTPQLLVTGP